MNFSADDLRKIGIVNRFIVHPDRTIDLFTDADKVYFLELYGRLSRCAGQQTEDLIAGKDIGELKIKGRDSTRCILVKPKAKNAFIEELAERGYRLVGQQERVRVRAARTRRAAQPAAAPAAARTRRVRPLAPSAFVASPVNVPLPAPTLAVSSSSEVEPVARARVANIGVTGLPQNEEEEAIFGRADIPYEPSLASSPVVVEAAPARRSTVAPPTPVVTYAPVVPPVVPQISNDEIIRVVRDTVQQTIREYISTNTPVAGAGVGGRKQRRMTMKQRHSRGGRRHTRGHSYMW